MKRHTYRLDLAYDGSGLAGFRRQPGARTVESLLVAGLAPFVPELTQVACGGRTDRGVHALGQVVSFWARRRLPLDEVAAAVTAAGEGALVVLDAREVPRSFHASFSAVARRYCYRLRDDGALDAARLDALLAPLVGRRCFSAFARRPRPGGSTVRHLLAARAVRDGAWVRFELAADAFLRRMVRVLVATAVRELHAGADERALLRLCEAGDRSATAAPADADGLFLVGVDYPPELTA